MGVTVLSLPVQRRVRPRLATGVLLVLLAAVSLLSLGTGAAGLSPARLVEALSGQVPLTDAEALILTGIRLPRLAMGIVVGAALAVAGALMQGLFRNPLADPGVIGVTAGAGLGAVAAIVLGGMLPVGLAAWAGAQLVPFAAFLGGLATTLLLARVAAADGQTNVATLLLAGIALTALAVAATGLLTVIADDRQLRDLTFWSMGSLAGASWAKLAAALPLVLPALLLSPLLARALNALSLGEAQAAHMGIAVERVKRLAILATAAAVGAATAIGGGIGFIGVVVPHLLRLATGPDHRALLPHAAILGATLLVAADMVARTAAAPAELPIGIITAAIGAPVFLWILLRRRGLTGI